jgi:hypothetical protein
MPKLLALRAPRPRERTVGSGRGGRGPTMASSGSELDAGVVDRCLLFRDCLGLGGERLGERDRSCFLCVLRRGDLDCD